MVATADCVARHQSCGFCSDHPSFGRNSFNGDDALASAPCRSSISTAFTDDVPMSMPR
jgi:hypothetical protein